MLRFKNIKPNGNMTNNDALVFGSNLWRDCKKFLSDENQYIPVKDAEGELAAYGYQDEEANRELRMLKELRNSKGALQFTDIFPEYKEVIILGCNELAVSFAEYLKELAVPVLVAGKYWNYFGYAEIYEQKLLGGGINDEFIVYAEGIPVPGGVLSQETGISVSAEFECIDRIYEANVLAGKITDTIGGLDEFICRLQKKEIVILGDDRGAQDTYDLLMKYGIDICGFAVSEKQKETLLGKPVMNITEAMRCFRDPVFLNYNDMRGALGEEWTEYFDYRDYERNRRYFLVKDYTDIPNSNLIHVLHGKNVLLTGDERLCQLLSEYFHQTENGEVTVRYIPLGEQTITEEGDILCLVIPDYYNRNPKTARLRKDILDQQLADMGFTGYTEYFISSRAFALIDLDLNRNAEKYALTELTPKGILIGRIPTWSGNVFFRGIMDGHPEVLMLPYSDLNENLFYYCVRLAGCDSDEVLSHFWEMYDQEAGTRERYFPLKERFENSMRRLLQLKPRFTSQELFVLFHIAYVEMEEDKIITDVVRTGSGCTRTVEGILVPDAYSVMFLEDSNWETVKIQYRCWTEFKMRFEDIKINPQKSLTEVCKRLGISWSDNMLQTTRGNKPGVYRGSADFDLKAVFNKYEDYLSEFDRFRISIASSLYQKRYGYSYESCLNFSRRELQEMFLKPFLFEKKAVFGENASKIRARINWQLWSVRKQTVLDYVCPEFDRFELGQTGRQKIAEYDQKAVDETVHYVLSHDQLILYGTGKDCTNLLDLLEEDVKSRLLYCDKKAESENYFFQGKKVMEPKDLCDAYKDYDILVTSSFYGLNIKNEFDGMGIDPSRVFYNEAPFSGGEKRFFTWT